MEDKQQKQAEMMLKSLEMMAQSMDTSSSLEEMAKLVADLIKFTQQNEQYLSTGFENLRSMFLQAQRDLKDESIDRFDTLKARLKVEINDQIETIRTSYKGLNLEVKDISKRLKDVEDKEIDFEPVIEETLSRIGEDTPEEIAGKLNTRKEIIEQDVIIGLVKRLEDLEDRLSKVKTGTNVIGGAIGGGHTAKVHDLSDSLNGVTKTFALPAFWRVLSVYSTSTPVIFRPTVDYTTDGSAMTVTFTDQIDAGTTLSAGQTLLVLYSE